jgi:hypothetical protein
VTDTSTTEPGQFPRELSLTDALHSALDLDTESLIDELNGMVGATDTEPDDKTATTDDTETGGGTDDKTTQGGADTGAPGSDDQPKAVPPGMIEFDGELLPEAEVRDLLALNARLKADPEAAQRIAEAAKAPAKVEDKGAELPSFIDPEDPAAVALWTKLQALEANEARRNQEAANSREQTRRAQVVDSFRSAVSNFKVSHPNLTDADIARIADATGKANIVEGLERSTGSLTAAFEKGMEMSLWGDESLRSLALADNEVKVTDKARDRKSKSSALTGGGGGTAPKGTAAPRTPKTRDELMAAMLADVRSDPNLT